MEMEEGSGNWGLESIRVVCFERSLWTEAVIMMNACVMREMGSYMITSGCVDISRESNSTGAVE